jgi:ferredoxin
MATIKADGKSFEAPADKRLVNAIEENGIDILHLCGGFSRCTTCRVEFVEGEPDKMTEAEREKLEKEGLVGEVRLSCQILCEHDMEVKPLMRLSEHDYEDAGKTPEANITPDPVWVDKP